MELKLLQLMLNLKYFCDKQQLENLGVKPPYTVFKKVF